MLKLLALSFWLVFHPVHVTLISIDHVTNTDSLKVFVKMYYDDFLLDYSLSGMELPAGAEQFENTFPPDLMSDYLDKKINIIINNKQLTGQLLDLTLEDNEISMNLLFRSDKKPRVVTVKNKIMTELYSDQANMTIIKINSFEEGIMLTPLKTEETFELF